MTIGNGQIRSILKEGNRVRILHLAIVLACFSDCFAIERDSYAGDLRPYTLPPAAKAGIEKLAAESDLLILGEIHGTREVPELVASFLPSLSELGYNTLAVEVPSNEQAQLLSWVQGITKKIPPFFANPSGDGRGNVQLLELIRTAVSPPFRWRIICFDISESIFEKKRLNQEKKSVKPDTPQSTVDDGVELWRERDAMMASQMLKATESFKATDKILAICGNLHARVTNDKQEPMLSKLWPSFAAIVKQEKPARRVHSVNIEYYGGAYFNGGKVRTFRKRPLEYAEFRSSDQTSWNFVLSLPEGTPAVLLSPDKPSSDEDRVKPKN